MISLHLKRLKGERTGMGTIVLSGGIFSALWLPLRDQAKPGQQRENCLAEGTL